MSAKSKTTALISEIDTVDLGVRLFEAVVGISRPPGLTASQAFATLPKDDQARVLRAAKAACEFMVSAINNGVKPS